MNRLRHALIWVAGGALLVAMLVDTTAMLSRQVQQPLPGAIEVVQVVVMLAASGALLMAAIEHAHARVHLLVDRMPPAARSWLERLHALGAVSLWAVLLAGSGWICADLWQGHEESELLRIPYRPLRLVLLATLLLLLLHALRLLLRGERR